MDAHFRTIEIDEAVTQYNTKKGDDDLENDVTKSAKQLDLSND